MSSERVDSQKEASDRSQDSVPEEIRKKALLICKAAIDKKAESLKVLNISGLSSFADYFVICSAMSDRQVQAISDSIESTMKKLKDPANSIEGYADGRWVVIDYGDIVVHIFLDAIRDYYGLERLWSDAPLLQIPSEYYGPGGSHLN